MWLIPVARKGLLSRWAKGQWGGCEVVLAKPQTFMNLSGQALVRLMAEFSIGENNLIVIHDDLDLPMGEIRIRERGGDGGHRGVKSIIEHLGQKDFIRVRMGIGRSGRKGREKDYVLEDFTAQEKEMVPDHLRNGAEAVTCILTEGIAVAMNLFNRRKPETV
jgi:peptidyl-tRNA hydrolase, PTH1 family